MLIDFENVQPKNLSILEGRSFKIKVFAGANQSKVPMELARALQPFGPNAEYVEITGNGKNALDFHIAYYIGRLAAENPDASFYVLSKDKGFDPLIRHLAVLQISCQRISAITDIPGVGLSGSRLTPDTVNKVAPADPKSMLERIGVVINNLTKRKTGKPRKLKTLRGTINALFRNSLTDTELDEVVQQLTKSGAINVSDGTVQYE